MRTFTFAALAFLCTCSPGPDTQMCRGGGGQGGGEVIDFGDAGFGGNSGTGTERILLVGSPQTVTLGLSVTLGCDETQPTGVKTSVVGPDNLPVASTQSNFNPMPDDLSLVTVDVTFTPLVPGSYHLVGDFAPSLGLAQADVRAAWDFTQVPTYAQYDAATVRDCMLQYSVTAAGTLLCPTTDTHIAAFRQGTQVDAVPGNTFAVRGNDVWVSTDTNLDVSLYRDTGTGTLALQTPTAFHVSSPINQFVPGDDDVLVLMIDGVAQLSVTDGGLAQTRVWPEASGVVAAARGGNNLIVAFQNTFWLSTDGGSFESMPDVESLTCIGVGPEGIWFSDNAGQLQLYTADSRSPVATLQGRGSGDWSVPNNTLTYGILPFTADFGSNAQPFNAVWDASAKQLSLGSWTSDGDTLPFVSAQWAVLFNEHDVTVKRVPAQ